MPKQYKKKRLAWEWTLDVKSSKLGYKLEGSERKRAKQEIRDELLDYYQQLEEKEWLTTNQY